MGDLALSVSPDTLVLGDSIQVKIEPDMTAVLGLPGEWLTVKIVAIPESRLYTVWNDSLPRDGTTGYQLQETHNGWRFWRETLTTNHTSAAIVRAGDSSVPARLKLTHQAADPTHNGHW